MAKPWIIRRNQMVFTPFATQLRMSTSAYIREDAGKPVQKRIWRFFSPPAPDEEDLRMSLMPIVLIGNPRLFREASTMFTIGDFS